jgi:hypothetical protein
MSEQIAFTLNIDGVDKTINTVGELNSELSKLKKELETTSDKGSFQKIQGEIAKGEKQLTSFNSTTKGAKGAFMEAASGVKIFGTGFDDVSKLMLKNPIGLAITAVTLAVTGLVEVFKTFSPVIDFISDKLAFLNGLFNGMKLVIAQFITGNKDATGSMLEMANAAERANVAMRDYEDSLESVNLKNKQFDNQIDILIKKSKNKNNTQEETNKLLSEAAKLTEQQIKLNDELAKKETSSLIEKVKATGGTYEQIKRIKAGERAGDIAGTNESLKNALDELQKNYSKRIDEAGTYELKREKIRNESDAKELQAATEQEKRLADIKAGREKEFNKEIKLIEDANKRKQIELNKSSKTEEEIKNELLIADKKRIEATIEVYKKYKKDTVDLELQLSKDIKDIKTASTEELNKLLLDMESKQIDETASLTKDASEKLLQRKLSNEEQATLATKKSVEEQKKYLEELQKKDESVQKSRVTASKEAASNIGNIAGNIAKLAGENAEAQKAAALVEVLANQGVAISSAAAIAFAPSPDNIATGGVSGLAKMAAFISAIIGTIGSVLPLVMEDGGLVKFANGGYVNGASHAQGGVKFGVGGNVAELEGGEGVINKRSMSIPAIRNMASALNVAGGGVDFSIQMPTPQNQSVIQNDQQPIKVYVSEGDISRVQNKVRAIEQRSILK